VAERIVTERDGQVLRMCVNPPDKRTIANGLVGSREGEAAVIADVRRPQHEVFATDDAREAIAAMLERRQDVFTGE
jgi:hypothetical protein